MKQFILLLALLLGSGSYCFSQEQALSPNVSAKNSLVEITYGQPSKRSRVVFGELVPYGEVWRAGANEATEITFKTDGSFAGMPVKAGTYTLFIIPKQKEWEVILNTALKQWGAYEYEKIKTKNALQATIPVTTLNEAREKLTYVVSDNALKIEWDLVGVSIPMSFK